MTPLRAFLVSLAIVAAAATAAADCVDYEDLYPAGTPLIGGTALFGDAKDVAIAGDFAYVVGIMGLRVIDVSDPANPVVAAICDTPGLAYGVAVSGGYAYIADYDAALTVIDVGDPASPVVVGSVQLANSRAVDVAISGSYAYLADFDNGVVAIDITDPAQPQVLSGTYPGDACYAVAVVGAWVYAASSGRGLVAIDISDPLEIYCGDNLDTAGEAWGVSVSGNYAYVADAGNGLVVADIATTPGTPIFAGHVDTPGTATDVVTEFSCAFVADGDNGLQIVDIMVPTAPVLAGVGAADGYAEGVAVSPSCYALLAGGIGGSLAVIDVENISAPVLMASIPTTSVFEGIGSSGSIIYLANGPDGIVLVDCDDPLNPEVAGTLDTPGWAYDVEIEGTVAYVADGSDGLRTYSLADPWNPAIMDSLDTTGACRQVTLDGTLAYLADGEAGLVIVDASDPGNLGFVGSYDSDGSTYDVAVAGNYAYLADNWGGFVVLDVIDPAAPAFVLVNHFNWDPIQGIDIAEGYAYLACWWGAVRVVDLADPGAVPVLLSIPGQGFDVKVNGGYCYYTSEAEGLYVVDAIDPLAPAIVGFAKTPSYAHRLDVVGDKVYVVDKNSGLAIAWTDCDDTTPVFLQSFTLEPAPGAVSLRWEIAAESAPADFRLEASCGDARWQVPFMQAAAGVYHAVDGSAQAAAGGRITYSLYADEGDGFWLLLRSESVTVAPAASATRIAGAWPNPFNPRVTLRVEMAASARARLRITDVAGRTVAVLHDGPLAAGVHEIVWDGRDGQSRRCPSGVYLLRMAAGDYRGAERLVLLE